MEPRALLVRLAHLSAPVRASLPVVVMAILWWLSAMPGEPARGTLWRGFWHNASHVPAYAALGGAWSLALVRRDRNAPAWVAVLLSVAYGIADEIHQSFVPHRVFSFADLVSDSLGAALGAVLCASWLGASSARAPALPWIALAALASVLAATFGW
ncbi:MAG: hypothetical protein Fur0037_03860 [Planctomycetota bacterium]